jgi:hypothetical protein
MRPGKHIEETAYRPALIAVLAVLCLSIVMAFTAMVLLLWGAPSA